MNETEKFFGMVCKLVQRSDKQGNMTEKYDKVEKSKIHRTNCDYDGSNEPIGRMISYPTIPVFHSLMFRLITLQEHVGDAVSDIFS